MNVEHLSIVVTHYETPQLLADCLKQLSALAPEVPVTVVDTSLSNGALAVGAAFPRVDMLSAVNHSMANAVNLGLKRALRGSSPFILQMNADVILSEHTLPTMVAALQRPGVGMVGPRCRTPTGTWQHQGVLYERYYALLQLGMRAVPVSWLSGCCQMVSREVVERVGGLDSSFRFYNEDIEWCWRVRAAGYRCELLRESVVHIGGASTPDSPLFLLEGLRGGYQLSRRYQSPLYRELHRRAVAAYANLQIRLHRDSHTPYKQVKQMFERELFAESPFGSTLNETNVHFLPPEPPPPSGGAEFGGLET